MDKQTIISAEELSLAYNSQEIIIDRATFSINRGDFVFITGPSGSGKSTLLKSFYGGMKPFAGSLLVNGTDMFNIPERKLSMIRQNVGIVFQDYKLIKEWTIEKNVMLPLLIAGYSKRVCDVQVNKLLAHVDLNHQSGRYPMELSGGEQQRVAMARALAHNPILILADEPTGNLDDYSSKVVWSLLEGANKQLNTTIVVVTHDIPPSLSVDYSQYFIDGGKIVEVEDNNSFYWKN
jgi:cell division transport system ATP-binding protein